MQTKKLQKIADDELRFAKYIEELDIKAEITAKLIKGIKNKVNKHKQLLDTIIPNSSLSPTEMNPIKIVF